MGLQLSDLILSTTLFVNALAIVARKRTTRAHDTPRDASAGSSSSATGDVDGSGGGVRSEALSGSMAEGADDNDRDDEASEALLARTGDGSANAVSTDGADPEDASIAEQLASLLYWLRQYGIFIALWNTLVTVLAVLVFPS